MREKFLKNIGFEEVLVMNALVSYSGRSDRQQNAGAKRNSQHPLFAFDSGKEISAHESKGDALVAILDGNGVITIDKKEYELGDGQSIVTPAGIPHAVRAASPFRMLLIVTFPL